MSDELLSDLNSVAELPTCVCELLKTIESNMTNAALTSFVYQLLSSVNKLCTANNVQAREELNSMLGNSALHFLHFCKQNLQLGKCLLAIFKVHSHLLFEKFNALLLLSLCQIKRFSEQVIDMYKTALTQLIKEQDHNEECAWLRTTAREPIDYNKFIINFIADCKSNNWEYASEGLRDLGFAFLETHLHKVVISNGKILDVTNKVSHAACKFGEIIISECFKQNLSIRSSLIRQILDSIFLQSSTSLYYVQILARFVSSGLQSTLECKKVIMEHFDNLTLLQPMVAVSFLKALSPVLKLKPDMREKLAQILIKAMFSKDPEIRKTAVGGLLLFLRYFQIMDVLNLTNQSQSQTFPTFSSQALTLRSSTTIGSQKPSYERLCLEVVSSLRKAFTDNKEIRSMLYMGLYKAGLKNVKILSPVVDLLSRQLDGYIRSDETTLPPILLETCISSSKAGVVLNEPLGTLILSLHLCFKLLQDSSNDETVLNGCTQSISLTQTTIPVSEILADLMKRMCKAELEDFKLDKSADYSTDSVEGAKNSLLAFQLLSIYEAFIECAISCKDIDVDVVLEFQTAHTKLTDVIREKCVNLSKKINVTNVVDDSNSSNVDGKKIMMSKKFDRIPSMRLHTLATFLVKLLVNGNVENQSMNAVSDLTTLRANVDFLRWIISVVELCIQNLKLSSNYDEAKPIESLLILNKLFYMLFSQDETLFDDVGRAKLSFLQEKSLDLICAIFDVVYYKFREHMDKFLASFDNTSTDNFVKTIHQTARSFVKTMVRIFASTKSGESTTDEKKMTKQLVAILRIVEFLVKFLPVSSDVYENTNYFEQMFNLLFSLCETQSSIDNTVCKNLWSLVIRMEIQSHVVPNLLPKIACCFLYVLGDNTGADVIEPEITYQSINAKTASNLFSSLFYGLESVSDSVEMYLDKLKQSSIAAKGSLIVNADDLRKIEYDVCEILTVLLNAWKSILMAKVPPIHVDALIKLLLKFYGILVKFVQFLLITRPKKLEIGSKCEVFEKFAHLSVSVLTPNVYRFLTFIQEDPTFIKKKTTTVHYARSKAAKEMKYFSALILNVEQYEKFLIQLGTKCKVNFMRGARLGTNRDFRIDATKVQQAFNEHEPDEQSQMEENNNRQSIHHSPTTTTTQKKTGRKNVDEMNEIQTKKKRHQ